MRRRHQESNVPPELAHYDRSRWERLAAEHPTPSVPSYMIAVDLYRDALLAAGVDRDLAYKMAARAVVNSTRVRLMERDAPASRSLPSRP